MKRGCHMSSSNAFWMAPRLTLRTCEREREREREREQRQQQHRCHKHGYSHEVATLHTACFERAPGQRARTCRTRGGARCRRASATSSRRRSRSRSRGSAHSRGGCQRSPRCAASWCLLSSAAESRHEARGPARLCEVRAPLPSPTHAAASGPGAVAVAAVAAVAAGARWQRPAPRSR